MPPLAECPSHHSMMVHPAARREKKNPTQLGCWGNLHGSKSKPPLIYGEDAGVVCCSQTSIVIFGGTICRLSPVTMGLHYVPYSAWFKKSDLKLKSKIKLPSCTAIPNDQLKSGKTLAIFGRCKGSLNEVKLSHHPIMCKLKFCFLVSLHMIRVCVGERHFRLFSFGEKFTCKVQLPLQTIRRL